MYTYCLVSRPSELYFGASSISFPKLLLKHRSESSRKWYPLALLEGNVLRLWRSRALRLGEGCSGAARAALQVALEAKVPRLHLNHQIRGAPGTFLAELEAARRGASYHVDWEGVYTGGHVQSPE